jgi:ribosomal protein L17
VQEPVELSDESIEELSDESSDESVQEHVQEFLEEAKDEIQDISEESVDEIKEPLEEPVEEEPIDKIMQEPVQEPVDEIQKPVQISKPADPMQKALEDLVVYAQNPRTKNRKAAIESIKAQDVSLVPRVERFYQAIDEYNKQDVKPTNIKRFVDKLSDSRNMSSADRSVLVADLQRALQLTDTEISPSPQTPPPSPKKVKTPAASPPKVQTPPASPKKVPASPKKVQTPPASPKKFAESPKRVPSPEDIAPVPDETSEDDLVWFGLEPDRPRVKAAGPPVLSQDLKTAYTSKIGTPINWDSLAVVPVVLRLRRAYAVLDYANQFNGSTVSELIEYAKLNAKLAKTRAELSAMSPEVQTALARDLERVLPLYMPQPAVTEDDSSSSSDEDQVAGRVTRHDLILKLVTELAKKFKTRAEWLPIIQQIKAKPSLVPLKALYPANMRKKAARDLKLLDNQLRETPLLIYLSLIDRVGHADFEQALASHSKTRT